MSVKAARLPRKLGELVSQMGQESACVVSDLAHIWDLPSMSCHDHKDTAEGSWARFQMVAKGLLLAVVFILIIYDLTKNPPSKL